MLGCVAQIDGWDPVAGAAVALRAASHDDAALCHLNGQTWWPALAKLPVLRYDFFDGSFGGQIAAPASQATLRIEPWPAFGRYSLADARIRLWTGEVGAAWAGWTLRFDGRLTAQPKVTDGAAEVAFAVDDRWLDRPLLPTYAGTTGAEGAAALKGTPKPVALGAPRYIPGVLIDAVNSVFQLSGAGVIQDVEAALERLARFGASAGDFASYAALVAATVAPGRWATCLAQGLVRFGAPPNGTISFLAQGDKAGAGGWARLPGQLVRRIAELAGAADKVDLPSLAALDAARPYNGSIYLSQQVTARSLIQELAASVNAVAVVSWTGQLLLLPVAIGTPTITLAADGSALPPVGSVAQIEVAPPFRRIAVEAVRTWTVHALGDVAFTAPLIDLGVYAASTTYREGNIVQAQGASWVYINPTPSVGNAPPTLPTTENAYWHVLAAGGDAILIPLEASANAVAFDTAGNARSGDIAFNAAPQNAPDTPVFKIQSFDGTWHGSWGAAGAIAATWAAMYPGSFASSGPTNLIVKAAWLPTVLGGAYGGGFRVIVSANGVSDTESVVRIDDGQAAVLIDVAASSIVFQADYLGAIKAGQLSQAVKFTFRRGGADVSASTTWAIETSGCTAAISATGLVTFSAVTASGYIRVTGSQGGDTLPPKQLPVSIDRDAPPPSSDTSATVRLSGGVNVTTFPTLPFASVISQAPSGTLRGLVDFTYTVTAAGTAWIEAALAYRLSGTSNPWTFFSAGAVQGTRSRADYTNPEVPILEDGTVSANQTQSVSAGSYEVGVFLRRYSGGQAVSGSGTLQGQDG